MRQFATDSAQGKSLQEIMDEFHWDINDILERFEINGKQIVSGWKPTMDSMLGLCHTFDPLVINQGKVPIKYRNENGQIHRAEFGFLFDVRNEKS